MDSWAEQSASSSHTPTELLDQPERKTGALLRPGVASPRAHPGSGTYGGSPGEFRSTKVLNEEPPS